MENNEEVVQFDDEGYNTKLIEEVGDLAKLGLTDEQIATAWGMPMHQFQALKRDKRFFEALQNGKIRADGRIAASMYKRAIGYDYTEEKAFMYKGEIHIATIRKHLPADPWAMARWLEVRQRAMWSPKQQIEVTNTNININKIDFSGFSDEEMLMIKQIQMKQLTKNAGGN